MKLNMDTALWGLGSLMTLAGSLVMLGTGLGHQWLYFGTVGIPTTALGVGVLALKTNKYFKDKQIENSGPPDMRDMKNTFGQPIVASNMVWGTKK